MPDMTRFQPGMPFWIDLASPAPETSLGFYRELLGWTSYTLALEEYGDYEVFTLGGAERPAVAGMQTLVDDTQPPVWTCYFLVADIEATGRAVVAAGGQELGPPRRAVHLGSWGLYSDSEGADFALFEARAAEGLNITWESTAMCWAELAARDTERARRFYGDVFGWRPVDRDFYDAVPYTTWKVGDVPIGGMVRMDENWPPDLPAHWIPYFRVTDCDATARTAVDLGAQVAVPPTDIVPGRFAIITDPTGARLGVIRPRAGTGYDGARSAGLAES